MSDSELTSYPALSSSYIEEQADALRGQYSDWSGIENPIPVPAEVIAEQFLGYELQVTEDGLFMDPDYLGGIVFEDRIILLNASVEAHEGRYNFTIAHEIGHHVLHRAHYLAHRTEHTNRIVCRETGDKPLVEQQADRFAAALLMPAETVCAAFAQMEGSSRLPEHPTTRALRALAAGVVEISGFSNVSNTAMVNRLIDLGLVSGAIYQTGRPQDFYRRVRTIGLTRQTLRWMINRLLHPLRTIKQLRRSK